MFLTKLILNKEITQQNGNLTKQGEYLQKMIKDHLINISGKFSQNKEGDNAQVGVNNLSNSKANQESMNKQLIDII